MDKNVKLIQNLRKDVADIDAKVGKLNHRKLEILRRIEALQSGTAMVNNCKPDAKATEVVRQPVVKQAHAGGTQSNHTVEQPPESTVSPQPLSSGAEASVGDVKLPTGFGLSPEMFEEVGDTF